MPTNSQKEEEEDEVNIDNNQITAVEKMGLDQVGVDRCFDSPAASCLLT